MSHLSLIHCTFYDCFLSWCLPFIHTLVSSDVSDSVWVDLFKTLGEKCSFNNNRI